MSDVKAFYASPFIERLKMIASGEAPIQHEPSDEVDYTKEFVVGNLSNDVRICSIYSVANWERRGFLSALQLFSVGKLRICPNEVKYREKMSNVIVELFWTVLRNTFYSISSCSQIGIRQGWDVVKISGRENEVPLFKAGSLPDRFAINLFGALSGKNKTDSSFLEDVNPTATDKSLVCLGSINHPSTRAVVYLLTKTVEYQESSTNFQFKKIQNILEEGFDEVDCFYSMTGAEVADEIKRQHLLEQQIILLRNLLEIMIGEEIPETRNCPFKISASWKVFTVPKSDNADDLDFVKILKRIISDR